MLLLSFLLFSHVDNIINKTNEIKNRNKKEKSHFLPANLQSANLSCDRQILELRPKNRPFASHAKLDRLLFQNLELYESLADCVTALWL